MKRAIPTIAHSALTNHRILARPGQPLPEAAFQQPTGPPDVTHVNVIPGREQQPVPLLTQLQVYGELLSQRPAYRDRYLAVLEELSKSAPEHPLVLSSLARKARLEGTPEGNNQAIQYLSKAFEGGSTSAVDYQDLAELLAKTAQTDRAIAILKQGIVLSPFQPVFYKMLALQYIHQKDHPKALETMNRHLELFPEDTFMRNLLRQAQSAPIPR
jgi:predicted Zn-dependent protease